MAGLEEMKDMIRDEISSIGNLEERVAFKELMEGVFLALYETNAKMYQDLEKRVMDDLAYDINRYLIRTGLIEKAYLDRSHHQMSPMCMEDLEEQSYRISDIKKGLALHGEFRISTVFIQRDALDIQQLFSRQEPFSGIIKADADYPVLVKLKKSTRYLDKIEHLYHLFMKNGVPWKTINAPYIFKMADVCIVEMADEAAGEAAAGASGGTAVSEAAGESQVTGLQTDFLGYNSCIHYDMVPIWNVGHLKLDSIGFPIACGDHKNYEHVLSIRDYGTEHIYLVDEQAGIRKVRQSGEKLLVTGEIANVKKWDVYVIKAGTNSRIDRYTYPVMENLRRDGFSERLRQQTDQKVKTKAELERFIRGFGLDSFVEYQDCSLEELGGKALESYSMNFFIKDEIRDQSVRKSLILSFKPLGTEDWLLRDLVSFITSEVQELYPEYRCGGRLV